ncbi:MAG: NAD(P)/FAD-dependent oxidoreductase [Vicinamibacterales bacterium]
MAETADILVMGSGQNTLGAAAYLAKAGRKVLVLEKHPHIGGGAVTLERSVPGFLHDKHSAVHILIQANPLITRDELGLLDRFGLQYHYPRFSAATVLEDFRSIAFDFDIDRTCASIAQYSRKDAETYREFAAWGQRMLPMMLAGMFSVPVPMSSFFALLEQSEDGLRMLDLMLRSPLQVVDELFESDIVKIHLLKVVSEHILHFPDDMGTGLGLLLMPAFLHSYRLGLPVGGSGQLSAALARCIEHHGGRIETEREVARVLTRDARAIGLQTTDGEQYFAKDAVIAAIHPRRLDRFIDGLDPHLLARARRSRPAPYTLFKIDAALKHPMRRNVPEELTESMCELVFANTLPEFLSSFEPIRRGEPSLERPLIGGSDMAPPGRVPDGNALLYMVAYQPYRLAQGGPEGWDAIKERTADRILERVTHFIPDLVPANILGRDVDSPLDIERYSPNSMLEGDFSGLGFQLFHTGGYRPTPELARFAVPGVDRLYLCGPFMHPGGGIFGVGRPTAIRVCEDLGIDFDRVCAR